MRSIAESTALIDRIIGRCVREPEFAKRVLLDPTATLAEYELTKPELDDFLALQRYSGDADEVWTRVRTGLRA
ncbi:MAG: hypothetical protein HY791_13165 [Deltaproteobacteria bacterium]|nr:hypothetical protein [Deltaproteobacteria bacterium]